MSKSLESQVWQSALDPELKPIAAVMADMGNDDGFGIYPAVEKLAWLLGVSERAVQYKLRKLKGMGIVEVTRTGGGRITTRHRLVAAKLPEREPYRSKEREVKPVSPLLDEGCSPLHLRGEAEFTAAVKPIAPDPLENRKGNKKEHPGSYKSAVKPPPEDSPHQDLLQFIAECNGELPFPVKEGKAVKWLLVRYSVDQCQRCFTCLAAEPWRTAAVTWKTVQGQIGKWVKDGEPETFSRNGKHYESAPERDARYLGESLDYLNNLSAGGGEDPPESSTLLLPAHVGAEAPSRRH